MYSRHAHSLAHSCTESVSATHSTYICLLLIGGSLPSLQISNDVAHISFGMFHLNSFVCECCASNGPTAAPAWNAFQEGECCSVLSVLAWNTQVKAANFRRKQMLTGILFIKYGRTRALGPTQFTWKRDHRQESLAISLRWSSAEVSRRQRQRHHYNRIMLLGKIL